MSLPQSILNIRREEYTKDLTAFMTKWFPDELQMDAASELLCILDKHFNLTLDQYDLDREKTEV